MKKLLVSILFIAYAFTSSGASVELHYCMGKLAGWDLDRSAKKDCSNCGVKIKPKSCCNSKQINPKVDKEQQASYNNIFSNNLAIVVPAYSFLNAVFYSSTIVARPAIHGPPILSSVSTYLFNCNFRI